MTTLARQICGHRGRPQCILHNEIEELGLRCPLHVESLADPQDFSSCSFSLFLLMLFSGTTLLGLTPRLPAGGGEPDALPLALSLDLAAAQPQGSFFAHDVFLNFFQHPHFIKTITRSCNVNRPMFTKSKSHSIIPGLKFGGEYALSIMRSNPASVFPELTRDTRKLIVSSILFRYGPNFSVVRVNVIMTRVATRS
jgi:hypothetical protein